MITIADAILAINSKAEVNIKGDNLDTCEIEWMNGTTEISKTDIKTKMISKFSLLIAFTVLASAML